MSDINNPTTNEATAEASVPEAPVSPTQERQQTASRTVRNYALGSAAAGLIPAPLVDIAALTAVQLKMIHSLCRIYGVEFKEELGRSALTALVGGIVPLGASRVAVSAFKMVPVVGQITAMVTLPALSTASTYAVGRVFIQHFESGGTFLTFDPEKVRNYYEEQLKQGQKLSEEPKTDGAVV